MELRLLLLGQRPTWLPAWKGGRLILGSAPTADVPLANLKPFHCLVEPQGDCILVHDLAHAGDVTDNEGRPVPPSGLFVKPGDRFRVGPAVLAVVLESPPSAIGESAQPCLLCGARELGGRTVAQSYLCPGCHGVLDVEPDMCPGYELVARIGAGGMGTVYLGHHAVLDRLVAIKLLNRASAGSGPRGFARFLREIKVLSSLDHPSIVKVLDARSVRGLVYLVSELIAGGDTLGRVRRDGVFAPRAVAAIGAQLASALDYAHSKDVIHRDVKPANVLLDGALAKLTDFGLAKDLTVAASTASNAVLGTIAYAAPEQLRDARSVGPPADLHGLAATLYHLATGRPPREGDVLQISEVIGLVPKGASTVNPKVPRELSDLLEAGLQPDPRDRPDMKSFGSRLAQLR